jgi:hypothetical protein
MKWYRFIWEGGVKNGFVIGHIMFNFGTDVTFQTMFLLGRADYISHVLLLG